jgi:hypothetical protein
LLKINSAVYPNQFWLVVLVVVVVVMLVHP